MTRAPLALLTLSLATPVSAQAPASTPAPEAPAAEERESPDWFTESSIGSISAAIPGHRPFAHGGAGNVPIVATDASGGYVDARDGRRLSEAEAEAALDAADLGGSGPAITVLHVEVSGSRGITRGKLENGSWTLKKGSFGSVSLDAGSAWGYASAGAAAGEGGLRVGGVAGGTLTLAGLSAATKTIGFGEKGGRVKGVAEGLGYAMLGADGNAGVTARVGTDGVAVGAKVGAFIGATTGLSGIAELDVAGAKLRVIGCASAGYGLGSNVQAFLKVDWANLSVRIGGEALAAIGPAAGAGIGVELSLSGLATKLGVNGAIARGVKRVAAALVEAGKGIGGVASRIASGLGLLGARTDATGLAASRDAATSPPAPTAGATVQSPGAAGAGTPRK